MFEKLMREMMRVMAEGSFELSRTNDVYRLALIASTIEGKMSAITREAKELVKEIENG